MSATPAKQLSDELLQAVYALPGGQKIKQCLQCGTCSASCPSGVAMEYGPRQIIASLRAGMLDRVLNARTVWLCVSCYCCTVRCPAGIPFTDVMYELKHLEAHKGLARDARGATLAGAFAETVDAYGRNAEMKLIRKYYLRTSPWRALVQIPLAMKLLFRGRMELLPRKIQGLEGLHRMMAAIEENGKR